MKLIVGLGNPGLKYKDTRHNLGFMVIDALAKELNIKLNIRHFQSLLGKDKKGTIILAKPLTFMNNSGKAVKSLVKNYSINLEDLVVICDDLSLDLGIIRIRKKGAAGGHNGLDSIIQHLNDNNFTRLRIGIGRPSDRKDPAIYVLESFTKDEKKLIKKITLVVCNAIKTIIFEGIDIAMNRYNKKQSI